MVLVVEWMEAVQRHSCLHFRQRQRGSNWKKIQAPRSPKLNIKKIQAFVKMTPPSRSAAKTKIKGRLNAKPTVPSLPALACAISLPSQEPVTPPPPSKIDGVEMEVKNRTAEAMLDLAAADDRSRFDPMVFIGCGWPERKTRS